MRPAAATQGGRLQPTGNRTPSSRGEHRISVPADEWIDFAVSVGIRRRNAARLVAFYLENAQCDYDFQAWVLSYVDPTGEEATRRALADQVAGSLP